MDDQTQDSLEPIIVSQEERTRQIRTLHKPPPTKRRVRLRNILVLLLVWLFGVAIGLSALLWYGFSAVGSLVIVPQSGQGNVVIEGNAAFVTQLVQQEIASAGLPGDVTNVRVELEHDTELIITGDDVNTILGVPISRHFTVNMQPYVKSCTLQMRVTHADLGGLPVTTFVQSFESSLNTQLAQKPGGLPNGFAYCTVGVRTEPGGLFITYQVTTASH